MMLLLRRPLIQHRVTQLVELLYLSVIPQVIERLVVARQLEHLALPEVEIIQRKWVVICRQYEGVALAFDC